MYPCTNCLENNWTLNKKRDFIDGYIYKHMEATCDNCGDIKEFGHKKTKYKKTKAEYEIRDGKRFLKINGVFKEVGLFIRKKQWKIMPLDNVKKGWKKMTQEN